MDTLKRLFRIKDAILHSITRGASCTTIIAQWRDTTTSTVNSLLRTLTQVREITAVFESETYVYGSRLIVTVTAVVELQTCIQPSTPRSSRPHPSNASPDSNPSEVEPTQDEIAELDLSRVSEPVQDPEVSPRLDLIIRTELNNFSNELQMQNFWDRYKRITVHNVLRIPYCYVRLFSPKLRSVYFAIKRQAKSRLSKGRKTNTTTVHPADVTVPNHPISQFAQKMVDKMVSGEVVNKFLNKEFQTSRLVNMLHPQGKRILKILKTHVAGTPMWLRQPTRGSVLLDEPKVVTWMERYLRTNYPGIDFGPLVPQDLVSEPFIADANFIREVEKIRPMPEYIYCIRRD